MKHENLAPLAHVLTWAVVMAMGMLTRRTLPMSTEVARTLSWALLLIGATVFTWAVADLKGGFLGQVEPVTDRLVNSGPYRWVRHPVYLSMVIVTLGLAAGFRSLWGLIGTLLLFVPAGVYRARLEEQSLENKFGQGWKDYARRTAFMFPPLW